MSNTSFFRFSTIVLGIVAVAVAIYFGLRNEADRPNIEASGSAVVNTGAGTAVRTGENGVVTTGSPQTNQSSNND